MSGLSLGSAAGPSCFQELLARLQDEHERQLGQLQQQICWLQEQLASARAAAGARDSEVWQALEGQAPGYVAAGKAPAQDFCEPRLLRKPDASLRSGSACGAELLELKGVWKDPLLHGDLSADYDRLAAAADSERPSEQQELEERDAGDPGAKGAFCLGAISPNSTWRFYWEITGLGLVCFDMVNIPLQVYNPPVSWFSLTMDWTTLIFWTCDMAQAFFVGYYANGQLVMKQPHIILHYMRNGFLMDLLVVGPDWFLTIAGSQTQAGDFSRLLRSSRAIRVLRLLRIVKLQRVINKLYDMIDNEYSFIIAELIKMMMVILVLNHVIACGWFFVGRIAHSLGMPSWITWSEDFLVTGMGYQYTTSLHWTLTQFTPASMDVVARNIVERIYSIIVLLFAMVAFSSIVGTVTSSMTVIRQMKNNKQKQFWMLRRYLKQKEVSSDLTVRMTRFLEHQTLKQEKLIQAGKVNLLTYISDQLARELAYEMFAPCLRTHAFFEYIKREMKAVAARICQLALKAQQVATGDTVFSVGEEASRTFIIKGGDFGYTLSNGTSLDPPLRPQEWLAEAVIWTPWRYRGKFYAASPSELLALEAVRFVEAMSIHPKPMAMARNYGQRFVNLLNSQAPSLWTDVLRDERFIDSAVRESGGVVSRGSGALGPEAQAEAEDREGVDLNGINLLDPAPDYRRPEEDGAYGQEYGQKEAVGRAGAGRASRARCLAGVCFHACAGQGPGLRP